MRHGHSRDDDAVIQLAGVGGGSVTAAASFLDTIVVDPDLLYIGRYLHE